MVWFSWYVVGCDSTSPTVPGRSEFSPRRLVFRDIRTTPGSGRREIGDKDGLLVSHTRVDRCSLRIEHISVVWCIIVFVAWRSAACSRVMSWSEITARRYEGRCLRCNAGVDVSCPSCVGCFVFVHLSEGPCRPVIRAGTLP